MQLPEELQNAIDHIVANTPASALRKAREALTQTYRDGGNSGTIFSDEVKRLSYLGARMPATYAAVRKALEQISIPCSHLLDLGSGPGTASWAAAEMFPSLQKITLIEKSSEAIALGQALSRFASHAALKNAEWVHQPLEGSVPFPQADAAILSYVLNELANPQALIEKCWKEIPVLVIVEPGTPKGFTLIRKIRQQLIDSGAYIGAPCPHSLICPNQWCHFSARVERSRLHRLLKEGTLGHEDEKFCYLIAAKTPFPKTPSRIIRHPLKLSGHVRLALCNQKGNLEEKVVTRKEKEIYRPARDAEWGDAWH